MTKDEKAIWIAVFADIHGTVALQAGKCRVDCIVTAIEEADLTILALRRAAGHNDGFVHRVDELKQEENNGRGVDVAQLPLNENDSV
jgi:hypothetical protein